MQTSQPDKSLLKKEIIQEFKIYDGDHNKTVDRKEFMETLKKRASHYKNVDFEKLKFMMDKYDDNFDDVLSFKEFAKMYVNILDNMILHTFLKYSRGSETLPYQRLQLALNETNLLLDNSDANKIQTYGKLEWTIADFRSYRLFREPGCISDSECNIESMKKETRNYLSEVDYSKFT